MLNKEQHQLIMGRILKDIYADASIGSLLGFKGGTCAYFFYDLPRFSVDLDFDLLGGGDEKKQKEIFLAVEKIISQYGMVKDKQIKHFTIFFLLSYGSGEHNIKIEINTRYVAEKNIRQQYELKKYLGIPMTVAKKEYLFANKLIALPGRSMLAMRDVFDLHHFAKNSWDVASEIVELRSGKKSKEQLILCVSIIEKIKDSQLLSGIGELVGEKQKSWIKQNLKDETVFLLKNYVSVL